MYIFKTLKEGVFYAGEFLNIEIQKSFLWLPVFLGIGILTTFKYHWGYGELPALFFTGLLSLALIYISHIFKIRLALISFGLCLLFCLGAIITIFRIDSLNQPVLEKKFDGVIVGTVSNIERIGKSRARFLLEDLQINQLKQKEIPKKIRINAFYDGSIKAGNIISIKGVLMPLPMSVYAGGYDFGYHLKIRGIGASGYGLENPILIKNNNGGFMKNLSYAINNYRIGISERILNYLGDDIGSLAGALITGHTKIIPRSIQDDFRNSGLIHLLVISGFNITLLSISVFFFIRLLISIWPRLCLSFDSKKIASVFAILSAISYCIISGASIPTVRAVLIVMLAFFAILINRKPISMNMAMFSAFIILLIFPESLLNISFQLSFIAVIALVGTYEYLLYSNINALNRLRENLRLLSKQYLTIRVLLFLLGVLGSTFIATVATDIVSIYHFHKIVSYGVISNLIAIPIATFWITPLTLLFLISIPITFLSNFILDLMAPAFYLLMKISHFFSNLPFAIIPISGSNAMLFALSISGLFIFCFFQTRIRYFGLTLLPAIFFSSLLKNLPDAYVDSKSNIIAINTQDKGLYITYYNKRGVKFKLDSLLSLYGESCKEDNCKRRGIKYIKINEEKSVVISWSRNKKFQKCDILVSKTLSKLNKNQKSNLNSILFILPRGKCDRDEKSNASNKLYYLDKRDIQSLGNVSIIWKYDSPIFLGTKITELKE